MRRTVSLTFALLVLLAPGAQAATPPVVAAGVTAAGTDVGGLTLPEAAQRLYDVHHTTLGEPVRVRVAGRRFSLFPVAAKVTFDINRSARRAYDAGVKAGGAPVDVPLAVTYDARAVQAFAAGVASKVRRLPRDARARITVTKILRFRGRDGREVATAPIVAAVGRAFTDPRAPRAVQVATRATHPAVTFARLRSLYGTVVTVDKSTFTLRLFKRTKLAKRYRVAVGMPGHATPTGLFHVQNKQVNPTWSVPNSPWAGELAGTTVQGGTAANPLKARWMGLANGIGIHGTGEDASIGHRASHGCIRMHVWDVKDLYRRVPVGTPVLIAA